MPEAGSAAIAKAVPRHSSKPELVQEDYLQQRCIKTLGPMPLCKKACGARIPEGNKPGFQDDLEVACREYSRFAGNLKENKYEANHGNVCLQNLSFLLTPL